MTDTITPEAVIKILTVGLRKFKPNELADLIVVLGDIIDPFRDRIAALEVEVERLTAERNMVWNNAIQESVDCIEDAAKQLAQDGDNWKSHATEVRSVAEHLRALFVETPTND